MTIELQRIGGYATGVIGESAAEIPAFDPASQRLFVVNGDSAGIDVLDLSDPATPTLVQTITLPNGFSPNSVAVKGGLVAVAGAADPITDAGKVFFFDVDGNDLGAVAAGALPDMLTFTADGTKILVANEGEPDGGVDPDGSVSIITLGAGATLQDKVGGATVATAGFDAFNGKENDLRGDGVVIAPGKTAAEDFEPEYIAVSGDGTTAFVTLQENNALGIVDIATATVKAVLPLGASDFSRDLPQLAQFPIDALPDLGTTAAGETIKLGGFSGLWFEGTDADTGKLKFITVPDRGPNGDPINVDGDAALERPFLLPDYQARVVKFTVDPGTGEVEITDQILLTRDDGAGGTTPITGLPNIPGKDEEPVEKQADGTYTFLDYDAFGADLEGVAVAKDGSFWMVDEYRPAIYHFGSDGVLIDRFVPEGTAALLPGASEGDFGSETLPEDFAARRANRGFEAIAYDPDGSGGNGTVYAFIQTPLANPNTATSNASSVIRILGIDAGSGEPVSEHVYLLEKPGIRDAGDGTIDKIGDAAWLGGGRIAVIERGDSLETTAKKFIFEIDLNVATNLLDPGAPGLPAGETLEQQTADDLAALGIVPAAKIKVLNLPSLDYLPSDKPEGLAVLPDGSYAVLNDNDFALFAGSDQIALGLVTFDGGGNGLDASDRDGAINIAQWPVYGLYQPDAIASFTIEGATYLITANEGDLRDDEIARIRDLTLDPVAFPDAAALQADAELGRLEVSTSIGDFDGDGDFDALFAAGARGFTIWDAFGNLVFSSGDQLEQITADDFPANFNSTNDANTLDSRSDDAGPEPEGVVVGTIGENTYAFIGLERIGGVMTYDITDPTAPKFVQYINSRDFTVDPEVDLAGAGDLGPEGLAFIPAEDSPNGTPLLVVANEVSGTTAIFQIVPDVAINEVRIDQPGSDDQEYFELASDPGTPLDGLTYIVIGDGVGGSGVIESVTGLAGQVVPDDGYFFAAESTFNTGAGATYPTPDLTTSLNFENSDNVTHLVVAGFTGTDGQDLDTNDDGVLDVTPWTSIVDSVALIGANPAGDRVYSPTVVGPDGDFVPGHVFREPDFDGPFQIGAFTFGIDDTPGESNAGEPPQFMPKAIAEIQGAGHTSPLVGVKVETTGIVTAVDSNGFYLQDPVGDGDIATSEGIFVFTGAAPAVAVGQSVEVQGTVSEFTPGGVATRNLSTTQISGGPSVTVLSSGNPLPAATVIGAAGRLPPTENIDDDAFASFDPDTDGIDFFESLEGMLVTAKTLVAVAGTNSFGEIFAVVDEGAGATGLSERGTLNISPDDFNPERIQVNFDSGVLNFAFPQVDVGDRLGDVTGVVSYNFGNFEIIPTVDFSGSIVPGGLQPETTTLAGSANQLTLATYNVLNLDPNDADGDMDIADGRFDAIATQIVSNLMAPDIIALQEVQDNSGSTDNGVIAADATLQTLIDAIAAVGGPAYAFIDNTFIGNNTSGGQPGGNIRTAYLYNDQRVDLVEASVQTIGSQAPGSAFEDARLPLVATFRFNGKDVTVVNNHFSSKGGSAPILGTEQPFEARQEDPAVNGSLDQRQAQSAAVQDFVGDIFAGDANANVAVVGDFNEFEFVSPLVGLEAAGLTNLTNLLDDDERYSFIFQGNSQSLDHILISDALLGSASDDTLAEIQIVHVNSEFVETNQRASDHDPLVARLLLEADMPDTFTLQLLHFSDQEAGIPALTDAPNLSGVLNALRDEMPDNTLTLSSGDAYLPGVFFSASAQVFGAPGRADVLIQNELGVQAISFGNHEFDQRTETVANLIKPAPAANGFPAYPGTAYPYLSSNLNFATDASLAPLVVPAGQTPKPNSITESVVFTVNGQQIGVVGATTPLLKSISSPGNVGVIPSDPNDIAALAAEIQTSVDQLIAQGIDKIVMLAHMQQFSIEFQLAQLLSGVDIIVAGGSHSVFADDTDVLRPEDVAVADYPTLFTGADGAPVAVINTGANYRYVGRLVVEFDDSGLIVPDSIDPDVSGAYATDAAGVAAVGGEDDIDPDIVAIVDQLEAVIAAQDGNVFGFTDEFLNGLRAGADPRDGVRTQETNLGDLTADANLAIGKEADPDVVISIKNGGGIRNSIGEVYVPGGGTEAERLPPPGNELAGKPEGGISQIDIESALSFNNELTLLTLTADGLKQIIEHGVAASGGSATPGQFPQVGGIEFSFDATQPAGSRVQSLAVLNEDGSIRDVVVLDGELIGDPGREFRIVTLNFLADGGDSYPFPALGSDRVDLVVDGAPREGEATFVDDGTEQDALAEYLAANFADPGNAFDQADTPASEDERIQNLAVRDDGIAEEVLADAAFVGGDGDEVFNGGSQAELILGGGGNDTLGGGSGNDTVLGQGDDDSLNGGSGDDLVQGGDGNDTASAGSGDDTVIGGDGNDSLNAGSGDDEVQGGAGDDTVLGFNGNDVIDAGGGNDSASGGNGSDTVDGGEGDDTLDGGDGNDSVAGGIGDDVLMVSAGDDTIDGGDGTDVVDFGGFDGAGLGVSFDLASGEFTAATASMIAGRNGYTAVELFTIGESINGYAPTGIPDGIGAYSPEDGILRLLINSEIQDQQGYAYTVNGDVSVTGARVSFLDLDIETLEVLDGGLAYDTIIGYLGEPIESAAELGIPLSLNPDGTLTFADRSPGGTLGFDRFCSSALFEANEFGEGQGFADRVYFGPQETDDGVYAPIDVDNGVAYVAPALGYGGWENLTTLNTGNPDTVGLLLGDDTSGAPLYLYVGTKDAGGDFLARNGLAEGTMYTWVPDDGDQNGDGSVDPRDYNGTGTSISGSFVEIDYYDPAKAGTPGWDAFGYALQNTMIGLAEAVGAMVFARIEDLSTNPADDNEAVFATTGRSNDFDGADTWGTTSTITVSFDGGTIDGDVNILYDANDDPQYRLRSADNLDWADDGFIYVQEDRSASWSSVAGINPNEASIIRLDPDVEGGDPTQVAEIDRSSVVPPGTTDPLPTDLGNWETSGILDISEFFGLPGGSVFVADVQAHSLTNGVIATENLVQGGQINLIYGPGVEPFGPPAAESGSLSLTGIEGIVGTRYSDELRGDAGDNILYGTGGNDTLGGRQGDDTLSGGDGNDELGGSGGNDDLSGGEGSDYLGGGAGDDTLAGDAGNDTVSAGDGNDSLGGGTGDDVLNADGGADTVSGGDGNDKISAHGGDDSADGGAGNDTIGGGQGDDALSGGEDDDELSGFQGDDDLFGGAGNDMLSGGAGDDILDGGEGENTMTGGGGDDTFVLTGVGSFDLITDFTSGADVIGLAGGLAFDDLVLTSGGGGITVIEADGAVIANIAVEGGALLTDSDFILV